MTDIKSADRSIMMGLGSRHTGTYPHDVYAVAVTARSTGKVN